jgi:DNA-binding TFAR19-related protein (PDSD5 family)
MSDTDELTRIRQRKLQALLEQRRRQEAATQAEAEKGKEREKLVQAIFMPDAVTYLSQMRQTKPQLATQIEDIAIMLFSEQQLVEPIPKAGVQLVERRLEGVESRITVKRRGREASSLYEVVRKDLTEKDKAQ